MRIGFDVAQTCVEKAGCGWYADALVRAISEVAPENELTLYHHFGGWINSSTAAGTTVPGAAEPFRGMDPEEARARWARVRGGEDLPGRPDIVHANCHQAPRVGGARLVYTVYDVSFWMVPEYTTEANRLVCQAGMLDALGNASGFVFISDASRGEFERVLPGWLDRNPKPWTVTPLGAKAGPPVSGRPLARTYWLSVGSLEPRKNHNTLLDAMELYWRRSTRRLPLRIAGGQGWKSQDLRERIEALERRGMVAHLGYVAEEILPGLYAGAEALIFPSWYEGFGLPVIEAMSHGCPVISSDRTSLREVGGEAALYIDPGRPDSIADAMLRLEADDRLQGALSGTGLRQAAKFTWEATARKTLDFYDRVLGRGPA
jgi:glycosyltransferase involved in cell wall biosynthesis